MRKFSFNLQRVLDYRETMEDKLLAELAAIRAQQEREKTRLLEMIRARNQFREKMRQELSGGSPDDIRQSYKYLNEIARQLKLQEMAVRQIAQRKDEKTSEVLQASKERKALEKLRDYKLLQHRNEAATHEQKFLDDVASIRHNRSRSGRRAADGGRA